MFVWRVGCLCECPRRPGDGVRSPRARVTGQRTWHLDSLQKKQLCLPTELHLYPNSEMTCSTGISPFITAGPQIDTWALDCGKCIFYDEAYLLKIWWLLNSWVWYLWPLSNQYKKPVRTEKRPKGSKPQTDRFVWQHQWSTLSDLGRGPTPLCPN